MRPPRLPQLLPFGACSSGGASRVVQKVRGVLLRNRWQTPQLWCFALGLRTEKTLAAALGFPVQQHEPDPNEPGNVAKSEHRARCVIQRGNEGQEAGHSNREAETAK